MKKFFFLLICLASLLGLTSCKKNFECACTGTGNTGSNYYYGVTTAEAEDLCDKTQTANAQAWGSADCTLSEN